MVGSLNLLTFPWLLKSFWAPILDIYGSKNAWLSLNYAGIGLALLLAKADSGPLFISSLVLLNLFSATIDLTLGKILIANFHGDELSQASSLQIIGYKVGFLFGGGITLLIADIFSLSKEIFIALAVFYFLLSFLYVTQLPVTPEIISKPEICRYSLPGCTWMRGFACTPGLKWMIICACVYKFASHSSQSILTMFLVDNGESLGRIGFMSGVAGQVVSIAVASVCGLLLSAKRYDKG